MDKKTDDEDFSIEQWSEDIATVNEVELNEKTDIDFSESDNSDWELSDFQLSDSGEEWIP